MYNKLQSRVNQNFYIKELAAPNLHKTAMDILITLNIPKKAKILDTGAGQGALSDRMKKLGYNVFACDVDNKQFLAPGIECKKANLNEKFPYKKNTFDVIIALELLEHLENPWNFIREAYRVLNSNGYLIISTPNVAHISSRFFYLFFGTFLYFWSERYRTSNGHINPLMPWELKDILKKIGFIIEKIVYNEGKIISVFKPFIKKRKLYFGTPVSLSYLPKNSLFGENIVIVSRK